MQAEQIPWLEPDPAAVFAGAMSLWSACHREEAENPGLSLSCCFNGMDQLMREVIRVAGLFEQWACRHILFEELEDVWPYMMEDKFGEVCLKIVKIGDLIHFTTGDCAKVAVRLGLPMRWSV